MDQVARRHPDRLIVSWRAAVEAAARRADIAIGGPYLRDDTVHHRRVATLRQLRRLSQVRHRWLLRRLALFDRATARGDEAAIQCHGSALVAIWDAAVFQTIQAVHETADS